jgi:hypothetical protein
MAVGREEMQEAVEQAYALLQQEMTDEEVGVFALSLLARATGKQLMFVPARQEGGEEEGGIES